MREASWSSCGALCRPPEAEPSAPHSRALTAHSAVICATTCSEWSCRGVGGVLLTCGAGALQLHAAGSATRGLAATNPAIERSGQAND